jgi:hypothetical protein
LKGALPSEIEILKGRSSRLRSREQAVVVASVSVMCVAIGIGAIAGLKDHAGHHPVSAIVFGAIAVAFGAFGLGREARAGVSTSRGGITVINPLRTRRLAWDKIERFSLGRSGFYARVGRAHLKDGRVVRLWAIQAPDPAVRPKYRKADEMIRELNTLLARNAPAAAQSIPQAAVAASSRADWDADFRRVRRSTLLFAALMWPAVAVMIVKGLSPLVALAIGVVQNVVSLVTLSIMHGRRSFGSGSNAPMVDRESRDRG